LFRLTKLSVKIFPANAGSVSQGSVLAIGYIQGSDLTTPTTGEWSSASVAALGMSKCWWQGMTVPVSFTVPPQYLRSNQSNWLPTNLSQGPWGNIFIGGPPTTAVQLNIQFDVEFQFKQPTTSAFGSGVSLPKPPDDEKKEIVPRSPNIESQIEFPLLGGPPVPKPTSWLGAFTSK
jgi:hypothetical protein